MLYRGFLPCSGISVGGASSRCRGFRSVWRFACSLKVSYLQGVASGAPLLGCCLYAWRCFLCKPPVSGLGHTRDSAWRFGGCTRRLGRSEWWSPRAGPAAHAATTSECWSLGLPWQPATHPPYPDMSALAAVVASGAGTAGYAATTREWSAMAGLWPAAQPPHTADADADALSHACFPSPKASDQDNRCSAMVDQTDMQGMCRS